ncbi:MAG: hypothetical protein QOJ81_1925 [Chloroflexota bacterium]|jgi:parallel beta-helix repeat protein|nr:hypothetical protein [Chloroflexota bacterium]
MNPAYRRAALAVTVALGMLSVVPSVAFATTLSCGDTIYTNTTLTADVNCTGGGVVGVYFGAKNITLNLNGYTIWGPTGDDGSSGIDTNYKKNVTVKNGTIANFDANIYVDYSVNGVFKNLTLTGEAADGNDTGVYIYAGANNTINNATIAGSYYGFYMEYSGGNWVTNNHITDSTYGVYTEYENGDHFTGNYAEYDYAGYYEDYSGHQIWSNNKANGDVDDGDYGFYFDCSDYGWYRILNNEATGNDTYGFYTYYCYEDDNEAAAISTFSGNRAHHNDDGSGNGIGWYDEESLYAVFTNNTANWNGDHGFELYDSGNAVVKWNIANHNGSDGFYIEDNYSPYYSPAVFNNNTANYNDDYGVDAEYGQPNAVGNVARHNGYAPDNCWNIDCNN